VLDDGMFLRVRFLLRFYLKCSCPEPFSFSLLFLNCNVSWVCTPVGLALSIPLKKDLLLFIRTRYVCGKMMYVSLMPGVTGFRNGIHTKSRQLMVV
jgi:hypothetical protein